MPAPRNERMFKGLYQHLRENNVPAQLAKNCADIVATETAEDIPRAPDKQAVVTAAWKAANGIK